MKNKHPIEGRALEILKATEDNKFELNVEVLEMLLLAEDIRDNNVSVVSVAGAFRKGKSFILDFLLRYLQSNSKGISNWLGARDKPLLGFPWKGGSERHTTGILMWSEIFLINDTAVILLDTQGTFDTSTVKDWATVFALSTMISSVQIYNLSQNIQEDDLQNLQLFTEYGRLAMTYESSKPFQKLQFLVRDWSFPYEFEYGNNEGLLNRRLEINEKMHPESVSLRKHIKSCFEDICCFLMPHPGLKVSSSPQFDGKLIDIDADFIEHLQIFVPSILDSKNLILKEIAGQKIKAKELVNYFKAYTNMFSGDELPEPKSMLLATAEANNLTAVANSKEQYIKLMDAVCGGGKPFVEEKRLKETHEISKKNSIQHFESFRKMGGVELSDTYKKQLVNDLDVLFEKIILENTSKNIFKAAKTPTVLLFIIMSLYVLTGILGFLGLMTLSKIANAILSICLVTIFTWGYAKYNGELTHIATFIDSMAENVWQHIVKTGYKACIDTASQKPLATAKALIES